MTCAQSLCRQEALRKSVYTPTQGHHGYTRSAMFVLSPLTSYRGWPAGWYRSCGMSARRCCHGLGNVYVPLVLVSAECMSLPRPGLVLTLRVSCADAEALHTRGNVTGSAPPTNGYFSGHRYIITKS